MFILAAEAGWVWIRWHDPVTQFFAPRWVILTFVEYIIATSFWYCVKHFGLEGVKGFQNLKKSKNFG